MSVDPLHEIEALVAFEGRSPGSDAERRAARHLERRLGELGREVELEPTHVFPNYPIAHALHALLAIVGSVLSVYVPVAGAALVLLAAVSAFGDLSASFLLVRRLTGRRASQNVSSPEDAGKPGVVVLTANYDAGRAGAIFGRRALERRAALGRLLRRPIGPFEPFFWALIAVLVCTTLRLVGLEGLGLTIAQFVPTVLLIATVPLLLDIALSPVVPGANGNASGVATVLRLAERFGGRLEHFDLWVVLPGAGEGLMLGMREWIRRHRRRLDPERTVFVDVDMTGHGTPRWIEKEGLVVALRYHPELIRLCEQVGDGRGMTSRNATSALAARAAGFPAIAIGARNALDYVPDWRQPTDTPERIDPQALERSYAFCCALLERLDAEVGPELAA